MRAIDLLKFLFEIITLIILIVLVAIFIETIIQASYGEDVMYKQYASDIVQIINGKEQQLYIPSYDLQYVPVLVVTKNNNIYLYMYKCNYNIQSIPQLPLWNVSEIDNVYLFAPDLSQCILLTQDYIGSFNNNNNENINIYISSLGGNAGYVALPVNNANLPFLVPIGIIPDIIDTFNIFTTSESVYVYNQTNITCNSNGCNLTEGNNEYTLECYLSYGNKNIEYCAELFGLFVKQENAYSLIVNPYSSSYLTQGTLEVNGNQYNYMLLVLGQFINNPILLIENENGNTIFYYSISVK